MKKFLLLFLLILVFSSEIFAQRTTTSFRFRTRTTDLPTCRPSEVFYNSATKFFKFCKDTNILETLIGSGGGTFSGHLLFSPDNTYDIGASGATRPRNIWVGNQVVSPLVFVGLSGNAAGLSTSGNGILMLGNAASTDFSRLQFGGTTSSFPAIKRNATGLEAKLADDSAYAPFTAQSFTAVQGYQVGASNTISWATSGSTIFGNGTTGAVTGAFRLTGGGSTTTINFGGDTSSFPSLKRNGVNLEVKLADDSGPTGILSKDVLVSKTGAYTITAAESGTIYINSGASTGTLPTPVAGLRYTFIVVGATAHTIVPANPGTQSIYVTTLDANDSIASSSSGHAVTLVAIDTLNWVAISFTGAWP